MESRETKKIKKEKKRRETETEAGKTEKGRQAKDRENKGLRIKGRERERGRRGAMKRKPSKVDSVYQKLVGTLTVPT